MTWFSNCNVSQVKRYSRKPSWGFLKTCRTDLQCLNWFTVVVQVGNYLFKVNNGNTRIVCICWKFTIKKPEKCQCHRSGVFIVNLEQTSHIGLVVPLLTSNEYTPTGIVDFENVIASWYIHPTKKKMLETILQPKKCNIQFYTGRFNYLLVVSFFLFSHKTIDKLVRRGQFAHQLAKPDIEITQRYQPDYWRVQAISTNCNFLGFLISYSVWNFYRTYIFHKFCWVFTGKSVASHFRSCFK